MCVNDSRGLEVWRDLGWSWGSEILLRRDVD